MPERMERLEGGLAEIVAVERRGDYLVPANPSTLKTKFVFYVYCSNKRTYKTTGIQSFTVQSRLVHLLVKQRKLIKADC